MIGLLQVEKIGKLRSPNGVQCLRTGTDYGQNAPKVKPGVIRENNSRETLMKLQFPHYGPQLEERAGSTPVEIHVDKWQTAPPNSMTRSQGDPWKRPESWQKYGQKSSRTSLREF
jgi:hypothetical protein